MTDITPKRIEELKRETANNLHTLRPGTWGHDAAEHIAELINMVERLQYANENAAVCQKHIPEFTGDECVVCALEEEAGRAEKAEAELARVMDAVEKAHDCCGCPVLRPFVNETN